MDPITIATTVITLATFLKDIIRVAQEIQQSVNKVSQNQRKLHKLSEEVINDLLDLKKFYDVRGHLLEGSPELRDALDKLSSHMHAVHTRCHELFPDDTSGKIKKTLAAFKAWSKCDEIEADIAGLKEQVQACYMRFTAFTVARLEVPIYRIEERLLILDEQQKTRLDRIEDFTIKGRNESENLISASTGGIQPPADDIATIYLHQQIETINQSLHHLASSKIFPDEQPRGHYLLPFKSVIIRGLGMMDDVTNHRKIVGMALEVIQLLQDDPAELSIQDGARVMVNLAVHLCGIAMYYDATIIGNWTVDLYKTLVRINAQVYEPYLILALRNLAEYKTEIGDLDGARSAIEDCIERQYTQLAHLPPSHHTVIELVGSLIVFWRVITKSGDLEKGLEVAQESLLILEGICGGAWIAGQGPSTPVQDRGTLQNCTSVQITLVPPANLYTDWDDEGILCLEYTTGCALANLSYSLHDNERYTEAYYMNEHALAIFRKIRIQYPGIFDHDVAACLVHMSRFPLDNGRTRSDMLALSEQAIDIYGKLCSVRPTKFTSNLIETLWSHALLLYESGFPDKALDISNRAVDIIRQSHTDLRHLANALQYSCWNLRCLKQNEATVNLRKEVVDIYRKLKPNVSTDYTATALPDRLCDLASDLQLVGKYEDGVAASQEAIEIYRAITQVESNDSNKSSLAYGLSYLCYCLFVAKKFHQAMHAGRESIILYYELIHNDKKIIGQFLTALSRTSISASYSRDPQAVLISAEVINHYQLLVTEHRQLIHELANARRNRHYVLVKHGHSREAVSNSEELVKLLRFSPIEDDIKTATDLMDALVTHAGNLDEIGRTETACIVCQEAVAIGHSIPRDKRTAEFATSISYALISLSSYLRSLGQYDEAFIASQQDVDISHRYLESNSMALALSSQEFSIHYRRMGRLEDAMEVGEKAVRLSRLLSSDERFDECWLPHVLQSLSATVADAGHEPKALLLAQEAVDLYQRIKSSNTTLAPWTYAERSYAEALTNLSSRHIAAGNYSVARALLIDAKAIYEDLIIHAPGYFPKLARTLDLLATNLCALGRHEEGVQIAKDLTERQKRLEMFDPKLTLSIRVALDDLRTSPSQQAIRRGLPQCNHGHLGILNKPISL